MLPVVQKPATSMPEDAVVMKGEFVEATSVYPHPPLSNDRPEKPALPVLSVMALSPPDSEALGQVLVPSDNETVAPDTGLLLLSLAITCTKGIVWPAVPALGCATNSRVATGCATCVNVAVTDRTAVIDAVHVPMPAQAPLQPVKLESMEGVAVRLTELP
jgi:hypothetical protein